MTDILVVEDNREMGALLRDFLTNEGYSAVLCESGETALEYFEQKGARLIILDIMLPGLDGFGVCRKIREASDSPIIIVSAKIEKNDKLNGLLTGADDYIEKPYDIDILLAKIKGIFRRTYKSDSIKDGDIILDRIHRTLSKNGRIIETTQKEFDLLLLLMENAGKVMNKNLLFNKIWGLDSFSEPQTLTVHIKRLRQKIEDNPSAPEKIVTVWGVGYRYEAGGANETL